MFRARILPLFTLAGVLVLQSAFAFQSPPSPTDRTGYVGDASCEKCHRELAQTYHHTPHHLTSQLATADSVHG